MDQVSGGSITVMTLLAPPENRLRAAGLRVTQPRVTVLRLLESGGHFTADDVTAATSRRVSVQGVYDVLDALVGAGLARRLEPAGSPMRDEARVGDNHHHVVCRRCGAVADVDCAVGAAPCLEPSARDGFLIDEAEVVFWGICPACQPVHHRREPTRSEDQP